MEQKRIPKIIHYCWFGYGEKPDAIKACMESWKKYLPDWEIIEWNESNYDVHKIPYVSDAYNLKKWAFVSDYARCDVLYEHGGVYLDVDVEFIKPLPEQILECRGFCGFESSGEIGPGLIWGMQKGDELLRVVMESYRSERFEYQRDGIYKTVNTRFTAIMRDMGLEKNNLKQEVQGIMVFPSEYFCAYDTDVREPDISENTICWHHYYGSWQNPSVKTKIQNVLKKVVGVKHYRHLLRMVRRMRKSAVLLNYIKSDLYRCYGKTGLNCFLRAMIENKGFNYLFFLRCVQHGRILKYIALPVYWVKRNWGTINIGRYCQIGYGLYIGHGGPVIVNDTAIIGNNVNLSQCVTIGSNKGKAATIEDNVYIGPNCCIVEDVHIGKNATIGAGAVVVKDIPSNAVAAGNPAKVLRYSEEPLYIGNRWKV